MAATIAVYSLKGIRGLVRHAGLRSRFPDRSEGTTIEQTTGNGSPWSRVPAGVPLPPRRPTHQEGEQLHFHLVIPLWVFPHPGAKPSGKSSGKHSAILRDHCTTKNHGDTDGPSMSSTLASSLEATARILQEIAAVGRRLEAMDEKISDLTVASTSIRADIAGFRETGTDLDHCLTTVEDQVGALPDQETELRSLRAKVTDLEDRSCRDNVRLFGVPEYKEGSEMKTFPQNLLPELTGLVFSPPLEFQRVHRIGPLHHRLFPAS
ncbi:hypothetical protein NDU88_002268 [Pleurodeles waltl]|uniref:Uncharacterized protein n=1 Tax=Pleurodeles waltl TaxID=8319 RepID=A0AAV7T293_PLEWA|nr:hypothetical protein NDU88_002268 [Pleurodeles waltl]